MHALDLPHLVSCLPSTQQGQRPDRHEEEQQHEEEPAAPTDWPLPEELTEPILLVLATKEDRISLHAAMCVCRDLRMAGSRLMTYAMIRSPADLGRFPRMATLKRLLMYSKPVQYNLVMLRTLPASNAGRLRTVESLHWWFEEVGLRGMGGGAYASRLLFG
jgi:hypothetical protein